VHGNIRHGFVYERVPHITLKSIANNAEIDVIWTNGRGAGAVARGVERRAQEDLAGVGDSTRADTKWPDAAKKLHADWWQAGIARQKEIDASIAAKAEPEKLYDKPYDDKKIVRVAGPFTVESLSPHRVLGVDENDELIDRNAKHIAEPALTTRKNRPSSNDLGESQDCRCSTGTQGRQDHIHCAYAVARRPRLR